jgi:LEA14-like dessication related protein
MWLIALAFGCAHAPEPAATAAAEVVTYDTEYGAQNLTGVNLRFPWELTNPTQGEARVETVSWTLTIEGEEAQTGTEEPGVIAAPGTSKKSKLVVDALMGTSPEAFEARKGKTASRYTLTATFTVATNDLTEDFEGEWTGDVFPSQAPVVSIKPQVARYGSTAELSFILVVMNPNPFDVVAGSLDYVIKVAEVEVAKGTVGEGALLGPGTETQFDISLTADRKNFPELIDKLKGDAVAYSLDSKLRAVGLEFVNNLKDEINFSK